MSGMSLAGIALQLLVSVWFQILFHSPRRGSFHLSLTVLVHYRSSRVFSLGGWTPHLPTGLACPAVLVCKQCAGPVVYGAVTLCGCPFQNTRLDPSITKPCGLFRFRSPLLAEYFLF